MAPHSSTLALRIPWMEEPGRLQSMRLLRVRHNWATSLSLFTFMHWTRKWQPTPVFLPGESHGRGEPGGLPSTGSHRVGHDWHDLVAAAADMSSRLSILRTSLVVQWLRLHASNVGGLGLIPGQGTISHMPQLEFTYHSKERSKIPHAAAKTWPSQINKLLLFF